jgi:hypothetical protein
MEVLADDFSPLRQVGIGSQGAMMSGPGGTRRTLSGPSRPTALLIGEPPAAGVRPAWDRRFGQPAFFGYNQLVEAR